MTFRYQESFEVKCKKCGSTKVNVVAYPVTSGLNYNGESALMFYCNGCGGTFDYEVD